VSRIFVDCGLIESWGFGYLMSQEENERWHLYKVLDGLNPVVDKISWDSELMK
jgi:hypothetical protein